MRRQGRNPAGAAGPYRPAAVAEDGTLEQTRLLEAGGDCLGVDLAPGQFHALVVLQPDSILFECKAGPYRPLVEAEQAAWAPREGEAGGADYLVWMKSHFAT